MCTLPSGILLVNKPRGITSHDVVDRVRKITGIRRVGHTGTLDPLADGLLIVLMGQATKRQAEFMAGEKEYRATIRLGATSDTDDSGGRIVEMPKSKAQMPKETQIRECLEGFVGTIEQTPPAYSAVKVGGKKAYEAARRGKPLTLKPRKVTIKEIALLEYRTNGKPSDSHLPYSISHLPRVTLRVACSKGTYIRALARDIGRVLGTGAYLDSLTRTRSGAFRLEDAVALDGLGKETWERHLLQIKTGEVS